MKPDSLDSSEKREELDQLIFQITRSGKYTEGEVRAEMEQQVSDMYGGKPTLAFSNCGTALYTMYRYLKSRSYDKVVVQNNTFYATASMAAEAGLIPVVCDTNPGDPSMSIDSMAEALDMTGARAVCLTHVGGWLAKDYVQIAEYCHHHKIFLLEDAAHAFNVSSEQGMMAGALGDAACFSFYPTKAVPGGEGGVLIWKDWQSEIMEFVLSFQDYGKFKNKQGEICYSKGFNFRMSEFDAAVIQVQLNHLDEIMANRLSQAIKLQDAGFPCLMGTFSPFSNYYKYPVAYDPLLRGVGKVYSRTDQIFRSCSQYPIVCPVSLDNSKEWAVSHMCLPLNEHMYDNMSSEEIREFLTPEAV